ncbi:MAG: hypothetical protein ACUVV6_02325 [Thermoplasmatota archaeon]
MDLRRILVTLEERKRWQQRKENLEREIKCCRPSERPLRKSELAKIREQISYYDSLLKEMKKELRPADRSSILSRG